MSATRPGTVGESTMLTVHGPAGVVDLTVPPDASLQEVAEAYAREARTPVPRLVRRDGRPLEPQGSVAGAQLRSGAVVVAVGAPPAGAAPRGWSTPGRRALRPVRRTAADLPGDRATVGAWMVAAVALGFLAAWWAAPRPDDDRLVVGALLGLGALVGCVPFGAATRERAMAAPGLAAAACLVLVWDPVPERLPAVLGAAALAGAVTAAVARATADPDDGAGEALRVWIVVGGSWFVVAALAAIAGLDQHVVWAVLLLAAVLAARVVPSLAIDIPDDYLIDLERLAVNAWSARDRPPGKRGRVVVPQRLVADVAARGARTVNASAVAVLVVVAVSAPLLLSTADLPLDQIGARCLLGFGGGALLLAARSYRHRVARGALRLAGLVCWTPLALLGLEVLGDGVLTLATALLVVGGFGLAALAVAVGNGWRSAWWSRRAEVAEVVCASFAVASLVVATGLFRWLWELTG